jgi:hypothetical protein
MRSLLRLVCSKYLCISLSCGTPTPRIHSKPNIAGKRIRTYLISHVPRRRCTAAQKGQNVLLLFGYLPLDLLNADILLVQALIVFFAKSLKLFSSLISRLYFR